MPQLQRRTKLSCGGASRGYSLARCADPMWDSTYIVCAICVVSLAHLTSSANDIEVFGGLSVRKRKCYKDSSNAEHWLVARAWCQNVDGRVHDTGLWLQQGFWCRWRRKVGVLTRTHHYCHHRPLPVHGSRSKSGRYLEQMPWLPITLLHGRAYDNPQHSRRRKVGVAGDGGRFYGPHIWRPTVLYTYPHSHGEPPKVHGVPLNRSSTTLGFLGSRS
jgi:hypothetical protein